MSFARFSRSKAGGMGATSVLLLALIVATALGLPANAADYDSAWLRYASIDDKNIKDLYAAMPAVVVALGDSVVVRSAQEEFVRGVRGMLGRTLRADAKLPEENAIILGTYDVVSQAVPSVGKMSKLADDGFWIRSVDINGTKHVIVTAPNERGVLYGTFALLQKIALGQPIVDLNEQQSPYIPLRLVLHPDRLDGAVNRGYAGPSIFWEGGHFTAAPDRVRDYARLLASINVNGISINDASEARTSMSAESMPDLARAADALRPWGIQIFVSMDADNLRDMIGARPNGALDESNAVALAKQVEDIYKTIPDLGGIVLSQELPAAVPLQPARANEAAGDASADSVANREGEAPVDDSDAAAEVSPPQTDGHLSDDATLNLINAAAQTLAPHNGVLVYRPLSPRAAAADAAEVDPALTLYNSLKSRDGELADNIIVAIPAQPVEAHLRQPPSPLFGALEKTGMAVEFDLTQAFLGQQRHLCFLVPAWKTMLDFDLKSADEPTPVKALVKSGEQRAERGEPDESSGPRPSTFGPLPASAFIAVANIGRDPSWLRDPLAMANLFGFGRLAWNPDLASKAIAEEWARLTFGHDPLVVGTVVELLLESWQVYESYTGPLGLGTLTDVDQKGYGPNVEAAASGNGFRLHADEAGVGVDRTASGSGFLGQYRPEVSKLFESLETCPQDLVLFVHHLPYTQRLKSGKTLIQQIYNALYAGAEGAVRMARQWRSLEGKIDDERYRSILTSLDYQAGHAQAWRDALANWILRKSGIADDEGRIGNYPGRFEAESMQLEGYEAKNVTPWETASGGQCAISTAPTGKGAMSFNYEGEPGWMDLSIRYFDENDGASQYELLVAGEVVDQWRADDMLPDNEPNGHTSTRHVTRSIALRKGDEIRLQSAADGGERAAVDYIEIGAVKP